MAANSLYKLLEKTYGIDKTASLENLEKAYHELGDDKLADIVGTAYQMMLRFDKAEEFFSIYENYPNMENLLDAAMWYGRYPKVVKSLREVSPDREISFEIDDEDYRKFLKEKALIQVPLFSDENSFFIDEEMLDWILKESGGNVHDIENAVKRMEESGNRNVVKRKILASLTTNDELYEGCEEAYRKVGNINRRNVESAVKQYCLMNGLEFIKRMQEGDYDSFFPTAASLFLAEKDGRKIVIKENLKLYVDFSRLDGYNQEKEIYESIKHPNIINYLGSFKVNDFEFLKFEFFEGKELTEYTKKENLLHPREAIKIVQKIAETLDYLHSKNIIYMDVKAKNFLYDGENVKMLDFGMARMLAAEENDDGARGITDHTYARSVLSTPKYIPPEMATQFKSYKKSDVFQLGILFYELLTGKHPFANVDFTEGDEYRESEIIKYGLANTFNNWDGSALEKIPPQISIRTMLDKKYFARPSAWEIASRLKRNAENLKNYAWSEVR